MIRHFLSRIQISHQLLAVVIIALATSNNSFVFWNQQKIAIIEIIFSFYVIFSEGLKNLLWSPRYLWVVLWVGVTALSTYLAQPILAPYLAQQDFGLMPPSGWHRLQQEFCHLFFGWSVWLLARRALSAEEGTSIFYAVALGVITGALINLASIIYRWNIIADPRVARWVVGLPFFVNIRHLGYLVAVSVVAQFFLFLRAQSRWTMGFSAVSFTFLSAFLFWIGGRASIGAVFITLILMMIWLKPARDQMVFSVASILIAMGLSQYFAVSDVSLGLFRSWNRSVHAEALDSFLSGRWTLWTDAWQRILERPWLGWGADAYVAIRPMYAIEGGILHPHNVFIQYLIETGLIGTSIFIVMCWQFLKPLAIQIWRIRGQAVYDPALLLGGAMVGTLLLLSLTEGIFYHGIGTSLFALACGLALSAPSRSL